VSFLKYLTNFQVLNIIFDMWFIHLLKRIFNFLLRRNTLETLESRVKILEKQLIQKNPTKTNEEKLPSLKILMLNELAGEEVLSSTEIADRIAKKHTSLKKWSVVSQMTVWNQAGIIEKSNSGWKITELGKRLIKPICETPTSYTTLTELQSQRAQRAVAYFQQEQKPIYGKKQFCDVTGIPYGSGSGRQQIANILCNTIIRRKGWSANAIFYPEGMDISVNKKRNRSKTTGKSESNIRCLTKVKENVEFQKYCQNVLPTLTQRPNSFSLPIFNGLKKGYMGHAVAEAGRKWDEIQSKAVPNIQPKTLVVPAQLKPKTNHPLRAYADFQHTHLGNVENPHTYRPITS
jgi:hypothetical protein